MYTRAALAQSREKNDLWNIWGAATVSGVIMGLRGTYIFSLPTATLSPRNLPSPAHLQNVPSFANKQADTQAASSSAPSSPPPSSPSCTLTSRARDMEPECRLRTRWITGRRASLGFRRGILMQRGGRLLWRGGRGNPMWHRLWNRLRSEGWDLGNGEISKYISFVYTDAV